MPIRLLLLDFRPLRRSGHRVSAVAPRIGQYKFPYKAAPALNDKRVSYKGRVGKGTNDMPKVKRTLSAKTPFSLKAVVLSHGWHECAPMSWCEGGSCFQIIERCADRAYRVSVTEGRRSAKALTLNVTVEGEPLEEEIVERFVRNLRATLSLDEDLSAFYEICRDHPTLRVLPKIGAGRAIRSASMTENIVKAVCGTNVNWTQAVKMINRIGQLGPIVPHYRNLNAWPTPREILKAGEKYLIDVCRVGYRAEAILMFCGDVVHRRFDSEKLDDLARDPHVTSDDLLALLKSVRGVGPSTAHYLLGFLGRHDRLSIDTATVAHVARTHTNGRRPTLKKIERIYSQYGPWKNKVCWFEHWLNWDTAKTMLNGKM